MIILRYFAASASRASKNAAASRLLNLCAVCARTCILQGVKALKKLYEQG